MSLPDSFWTKVAKQDDGCWLWTGALDHGGYGKYRGFGVHRVVFTEIVGPIPAGLQLDHLCRVRPCVNPDHLQPVTHLVNVRRSPYANKSHCPQGHPYSGPNLVVERRGSGFARKCRICCNSRRRVSAA